jgi:hypothetical protein
MTFTTFMMHDDSLSLFSPRMEMAYLPLHYYSLLVAYYRLGDPFLARRSSDGARWG